MRIAKIHDIVAPISSQIANAYIDFSQMTASVVAIHCDCGRDGKPLVGFGFNSNGRYAVQGLLRERFIPRLLEAPAEALLDDEGLIDPAKAWPIMMANEKPGGMASARSPSASLTWRCGICAPRPRESRCGASSPSAIARTKLAARLTRTPGFMPPGAITTRARTSPS